MTADEREMSEAEVGLLRTAMGALYRGGHEEQPEYAVIHAALNYCIRQNLSRVLITELEEDRASLVYEGDTLYFQFGPDTPGIAGEKMGVARIVDGEVEYL